MCMCENGEWSEMLLYKKMGILQLIESQYVYIWL